jgi:hypothetical protein
MAAVARKDERAAVIVNAGRRRLAGTWTGAVKPGGT